MTIDEVIAHYGSNVKAAEALDITTQAISSWRKYGRVPFNTQYRIETLSGGALVADRKDHGVAKASA